MAIFRVFRDLRVAIEELVACMRDILELLVSLVKLQEDLGPARDRLEALELSRAQFEAECNGVLLKAEGKYKAASNAEARERALLKSHEKLVDDFDPDRVEPETTLGPVHTVDAEEREEERLHALHLAVAPNDKASALAHKWRAMR